MVDFPSGVTDTTPTFLVGGDAGNSTPAKAACGTAGLSILAAASTNAAQAAIGLGIVSGKSANYQLVPGDDGKTFISTGSIAFTVNAGLGAGFGCSFKGTSAFSGSATISDVRPTCAANPWCALIQTGTDTYDVVGSKA